MSNRKTNTYSIIYLIIYSIATAILVKIFHESIKDILTVFFSLGIVFPLAAWYFTKDIFNRKLEKPALQKETWIVVILIAWVVLYISYGSGFIDRLIPKNILQDQRIHAFIILIKKLLVFVVIPFLIYRLAGLSLKDFGLRIKPKEIFTRKNLLLFIALSVLITVFQFYFSNGGRNFRQGHFSAIELIAGFPLLLIWLFIEVGLVEEFFFRGLLQSRLAVLLKSPAGGIVISGLIFGLVHAPGLYLRGAESEGIDGHLPFHFFAAYSIVYMSIAGIFLGIIYHKTKNLWLVMALHAVIDLVPNFPDFINTWGL